MTFIVDLLNLLKIHIDGPEGHVLEGDALVNVLVGTGGDDYVEGKGLADILSGGAGNDTLSYLSSPSGVTIDLTPGFFGFVTQASGGDANGDIITADFENLIGSYYDDTLKGTGGANTIAGLAGNDSLYGKDGDDILIGGAGADHMDGGNGYDIVDYSSSTAAISLVADAQDNWTGAGGDAQGDTFSNIEKIIGSHFDDIIDDSLATKAHFYDGGGGNDTEIGGSGDDEFVVEHGVNHFSGGAGHNKFDFYDATFAGDSTDPAHPTDHGELASDGGMDIDFSSLTSGVEITLSEETNMPFMSSGDNGTGHFTTLAASTISRLYRSTVTLLPDGTVFGSSRDDTITPLLVDARILVTGSSHDDTITLTGGAVRETLWGGSGGDTFVFTAASASPAGADSTLDRIEDFTHGEDKINLSAIARIISFTPDGFTGVAGQVHVVASDTPGYVKVELDSDGNSAADLAVLVHEQNSVAWSASDFGLL
ncbi:M10 family metallopeptidase C-terminal domain-containing protein [Phyllobacterium sp. LjRoot231]|uniref:calcium-binding protein n=1 Tax=Phyllobacterium sp. LjRoot231 TaxID=3342289 RepID=UPI003ECE7669